MAEDDIMATRKNELPRISLAVTIALMSAVTIGYASHGKWYRRVTSGPRARTTVNATDYLRNRTFYSRPWTESLQGVEKPRALTLPKDLWSKKITHLLKLRQIKHPGK